MRKWKVFLSMLCAMLAAIGLFACKNDDGDDQGTEPGPTPGPVLKDNDIQTITRIQGYNSLSFTDADVWDDVLGTLQEKIKVTCRTVGRETITVEGSACTFISEIVTDASNHFTVGNYTIKVQPTENNPGKVTGEFKVPVTHDFEAGATEDDPEVCSYCQATRTSAVEDTIIHYGTFHTGTDNKVPAKVYGEDGTDGAVYTNKNDAEGKKSYIDEFGSVVDMTGGTAKNVKVPTLTAGQLEPGMTITVKGQAQTAWNNWGYATDDGYFFPVIGFADRYNNTPVFEGTPATGYTGGSSVFVRGEGWVLYNGIGNATTDHNRPLGALSMQTYGQVGNGTGEARNYGSHELATLGTSEKRPASFTPGQIPAVSDWQDWVVYSTGNPSSTTAYNDLVDLTLTWNYRQDGIIEMTYDVNGSVLTAMVKVPEATMGYYDTILHGDYVDMIITSYERIETRTPETFAIKSITAKNYYEGEAFDPSTINAVFTYKQSGNTEYPQGLTLSNVWATTDETVTNDTVWVSLAENPAMKTGYKNFKVQVNKGGEVWTEEFTAAEGSIAVVANKIESAAGADVGVFKNNNTVGALALGTQDGKVVLTPVGEAYAQTIPTGATWTNGTLAEKVEYRFVSLKIGAGELSEITAVKSGSTNVPYNYDKASGTLVLALTADTKVVTVEGLQTSVTVFDFSEAKGFNVNEEINKPTGNHNWALNNTANTVTVKFMPNEGKTIGTITVGAGLSYRNPQDLIDILGEGDDSLGGITVKANGTSWAEGVLTLVVEYPAADLANYAQREIRIFVDGETEFVFKIDYVADFVNTNSFDSGWYSYVSNGKIYLAQKASNDGGALTLNLNEGNENVSLIDLGYAYADGVATLNNAAALEGAAISVLNVAGDDIVIIEVDPAKYEIKGAKYGYQLKTENYSEKFFAVANNTATLTAIPTGKTIVLNEGSCLEKGLSGNLVKVGDVSFVANPAEFGGSHSLTLTSGGKCSLCGATFDRTKLPQTVTLNDGEYFEYDDAFHSGLTKLKEIYHGITVKLNVGSDFYWFRNDGFVSFNDYGTALESEQFTTSFGEETAQRTPLGKVDDQGNLIPDQASYLAVLSAGAKFRINASYQDGTFTLVWRVYRADGATIVTGYDKPAYFEFWHKVSGIEADSVSVAVGVDGIAATDIGDTTSGKQGMIWRIASDKLDKSMIKTVSAESVSNAEYAVGNIENHFATVSATGGNATDITEDVKTKLGLEADDTTYTKYVSFDIALTDTNYSAYANVYTDAAFTTACANAIATIENGVISVTAAFGDGNLPGTYYIDLRSLNGNTKQADIKLDLSVISMYNTQAAVVNSAKLVTGGKVTITYTGTSDALLEGAKFVVNGEEQAIAPSMTFTGMTATWAEDVLTLNIAPQANLTAVPQYTVSLVDATGKAAATSKFEITQFPETGVFAIQNENAYLYAEGSNLYFYLIGEASTGKDYLLFNVNNADTDKARILPYSLAYSLASGNVRLAEQNAFTENVTATHFESGSFKVTQFAIDLGYFGIKANAAYLLEVLMKPITDGTVYYTVSDSRGIDTNSVIELPEKSDIVEVTCEVDGTRGCKVENVGYYAIEMIAHGHVFPADGGLCTRCEEVTGWVKEGVSVGAVGNSTGWTSAHGTNKAYNPDKLTDRFSSVLPGQKVVAEGILTSSTANNWNGIAALLYPADNFVDGTHLRIDSWINAAGNPQGTTLTAYNLDFAKTNSGNFETMNVIKAHANLTITWDWSNVERIAVTISLDGIDEEGTFWVTYTFTPSEGHEFMPQYSIGIGPDAGHFEGKITATASKDVVPADKCNPVKHEHDYSYDTEHDKCWCGQQNPNHVHNFTNNGYCSLGDGALCPHANVVDNICSDCKATIAVVDGTPISSVANYWNDGTLLGTIAKSTETEYNSISFEATYKTCTGWAGIGFQLKDGGTVLYRFRHDGAYLAPGKDWNAAQNNNVVATSGNTGAEYVRTGYTVKGTITFDKNGVLRIYFEHWNGDTKVDSRDWTISNLAKDSYTINIGMDPANSSSIDGNVTVKTSKATWTAAPSDEN